MPDIEMRRVVDGKIYDTTKSSLVATIASRGTLADYEYEYTQLFRTKKGNFFLAGRGGPWSRWKRRSRNDDGWIEGYGIQPVDHEQARELVQIFANHDYDAIFSCEEA